MKIRFLKLVKLIFVGNQFPNNEKNHLCSYELKGQKNLAGYSFILTYVNECYECIISTLKFQMYVCMSSHQSIFL